MEVGTLEKMLDLWTARLYRSCLWRLTRLEDGTRFRLFACMRINALMTERFVGEGFGALTRIPLETSPRTEHMPLFGIALGRCAVVACTQPCWNINFRRHIRMGCEFISQEKARPSICSMIQQLATRKTAYTAAV